MRALGPSCITALRPEPGWPPQTATKMPVTITVTGPSPATHIPITRSHLHLHRARTPAQPGRRRSCRHPGGVPCAAAGRRQRRGGCQAHARVLKAVQHTHRVGWAGNAKNVRQAQLLLRRSRRSLRLRAQPAIAGWPPHEVTKMPSYSIFSLLCLSTERRVSTERRFSREAKIASFTLS